MNKIYKDLNECINDVLKLATDFAIEGVNSKVGGPFGAGIIQKLSDNEYKILVIERNNVISSNDVTSHAEVNAIRKACKILNRIKLDDCILVSTAKSCPMCFSTACWANIQTIYYGVDYSSADASGFRDSNILDYLTGKNDSIIKEIHVKDDYCNEPFKAWENLEDKIMY